LLHITLSKERHQTATRPIAKLEQRLADADRRAERAEQRLHETTLMLSNLALQSVTATTRSNAAEVLVDGKSILRLNNPIAFASQGQTLTKRQA
jgi:seryl-tRNA synthetase